MIEYVNLLLLLTNFGSTCYAYYKLKKFFYLISIMMDSEILDQLTNLEKNVDSEFPKPKRGRKKKIDTKMNELEDNDIRDKRERLVACVLSGNSKMYLGKEYEGWIGDMGIDGPTFVPKSGYFLLIWVKVCPQKLAFS